MDLDQVTFVRYIQLHSFHLSQRGDDGLCLVKIRLLAPEVH